MAAGDNSAVSGLDAAGATYQADAFLQANGDQRQAVVLGDATGAQTAKVDVAGSMAITPQAVQLTGSSTTYSTSMTVSLGALTPFAGGSLPDYGSVEVYIINGTNQSTASSPQMTFTGDAINGQTPLLANNLYNVFLNPVAAGATGVQKLALVGGILRNVAVVVPFGTAPTTGTLTVLAVFHPQRSGMYMVDPNTGVGVRSYTEGTNFADAANNLLVMGREYGGGGANAIPRALHVDPDGAQLPVSTRVVSSVTAAAGTAVTATLPAPAAGYWNHVTGIQITKYCAAAITGTATPIIVTTTGLPGPPSYTFASAGAIGTSEEKDYRFMSPLRATAAATAVTVVCPATTGVLWRVNLLGYVA